MNAEMKANRIVFRKIKQQYDLLQMKSAYILGEMELQHDDNFEQEPHFMMDPETFKKDHRFISISPHSPQASNLRHQIKGLEALKESLLAEEKYEEVIEADELLTKLKKELNRIDNGI